MTPAIGYGVREENRGILDDPAINAAEITFEQADDPLRIDRYLGHERDFDVVSVHALELSVACPEPPAQKYLDAIKAVAQENGAQSISDHLGFTRDGNGRISIPASHRSAVGIEKKAVLLGMGDKFELWSEQAHHAQIRQTISDADLSEELLDLQL